MAIYYNYPTATDLENLLVSAGFLGTLSSPADNLGFERAIDSAIESFEEKTLYTPFLASATASTRKFRIQSPPQKLVDLGAGLIPDSVTAVTLGDLYDPTTNPETLTLDEDYVFVPYAPQRHPQTAFKFTTPRTGVLSITGRWGYGTVVPADAYQSILYDAATSLMDAARSSALASGSADGISGNITEVTRGELTVRLANSTGDRTRQIEAWKAEAKATMLHYRRKSLL